ncbi:MAG: Holliday junction branch migration protein RuvA, partial [Brevundimonas sp.]
TFSPVAVGVHSEAAVSAPVPSIAGEAVAAVLGLGIAEMNARRAVEQALSDKGEEAGLSAIIRAALQELGK